MTSPAPTKMRAREWGRPMTNDRAAEGTGFQLAETSGVNPSVFTKPKKKGHTSWTPERVQLLKVMWSRGDSLPAIAEALGVTIKAVYGIRFKYRLPVRKITSGRPSRLSKRVRGKPKIKRVAFETSRLMEFCTRRELENQTAHQMDDWGCAVVKELIDNALDASEEAEIVPVINVSVTSNRKTGITYVIEDNGPGIPAATVAGIIDYTTRTSSREAYVSPTRGAQGNALKTILPMSYVLQSEAGAPLESKTLIEARGVAHTIRFNVDRIRMEPMIEHDKASSDVRVGTRVTVSWPHCLLDDKDESLIELVANFAWVNPHLSVRMSWNGVECVNYTASNPAWTKWLPSNPTCPHWYDYQRFERYMAAHVARRPKKGRAQFTVRDFLSEFRGLTSTIKQKAILEESKASHMPLAEFFGTSKRVDTKRIGKLLESMKRHTKKVPAQQIGVIGEDHFLKLFVADGGDPETFQYRRKFNVIDGVPRVIEFAFGVHAAGLKNTADLAVPGRRLINAVNWSAAIGNPFRSLGRLGEGAESLLTDLRAHRDDPIIAVLHYACPRVAYLDRGKSAIALD